MSPYLRARNARRGARWGAIIGRYWATRSWRRLSFTSCLKGLPGCPGTWHARPSCSVDDRQATAAASRLCTVTVPAVPSTSMRSPVRMRLVALLSDTTHGMPSSRLTIAACENGAPTSTTTADAPTNSGVHDGSVMGATRTSSGSSSSTSSGLRTTRARPRALPGLPATPAATSPTGNSVAVTEARRTHSVAGGTSPATTNGGTRPNCSR